MVVLPAPHLGGSGTGQDPQNKAHTAACLISPSRAGPIETHMFVFVKVEISPYYVSSRSADAVQLHHTWPSGLVTTCGSHGTTAAVLWSLSIVIATGGDSVCMCVCALPCQVFARGVCAVTKSVPYRSTQQ